VKHCLRSSFYELFPPDDDRGDYYYRVSDYHFLMQAAGYKMLKFSVQSKRTAVVIAAKGAV
jgi:hypothetical protein